VDCLRRGTRHCRCRYRIASEAAYAHGHKKYIVFLAEEGTEVKKGILGADYEHLTFPRGNVEKAFSDLLYALPS
jgi:hypothetical protein